MKILTEEDMHYGRNEHVNNHEHNQGIQLTWAPVQSKQLK